MLRQFLNKYRSDKEVPKHIVNETLKDPDFPVLVSYPRTGSHWLRMMVEQYSDRPLLVRSFYDHDNKDYLLYHTHDDHLNVKRKNVIYLYREPATTIYSLINYYKQDWRLKHHTLYWVHQYAVHLAKWNFLEDFTTRKTIVRYDRLLNDPANEFKKVCEQLNLNYDLTNIVSIHNDLSKSKVKSKTDEYNKAVITQSDAYEEERTEYLELYETMIATVFEEVSDKLLGDPQKLNSLF